MDQKAEELKKKRQQRLADLKAIQERAKILKQKRSLMRRKSTIKNVGLIGLKRQTSSLSSSSSVIKTDTPIVERQKKLILKLNSKDSDASDGKKPIRLARTQSDLPKLSGN